MFFSCSCVCCAAAAASSACVVCSCFTIACCPFRRCFAAMTKRERGRLVKIQAKVCTCVCLCWCVSLTCTTNRKLSIKSLWFCFGLLLLVSFVYDAHFIRFVVVAFAKFVEQRRARRSRQRRQLSASAKLRKSNVFCLPLIVVVAASDFAFLTVVVVVIAVVAALTVAVCYVEWPQSFVMYARRSCWESCGGSDWGRGKVIENEREGNGRSVQCRKRPTGDWRTAARREKVQKKNSKGNNNNNCGT